MSEAMLTREQLNAAFDAWKRDALIAGIAPPEWQARIEAIRALALSSIAMREALNKIAMFNDIMANRCLASSGTYKWFDEPVSVQIARETLASLPEPNDAEAYQEQGK